MTLTQIPPPTDRHPLATSRHCPRLQDVKAILFDWAGTTIDCGSVAPVRAVMQAFRHFGIEVSEDEARQPMGQAKADHIRAMLRMPGILKQWRQLDSQAGEAGWTDKIYRVFLEGQLAILAEYSTPIPGVIEGISYLTSQGVRIGSTTGYTRVLMDVVVPTAAALGYSPEVVVCADDVKAGRPAPWMNLRAAELLGVYPMNQIIAVDDSVVGVQAAKNAGCFAVGISLTGNGFGMTVEQLQQLDDGQRDARRILVEKEFYAAGADLVVDSVAQLIQLLRQNS